MRTGRGLLVAGVLLWGVGCGGGDAENAGNTPPGVAGSGGAGASSGNGGQAGSSQAGQGGDQGGGQGGAGQAGDSQGGGSPGGQGGSAGGDAGAGQTGGGAGQQTCSPGQRDCPCLVGNQCLSVADYCKNGVCREIDCAPGSEGCACLAGGCGPGLFCKDGAECVDSTGYEGGACLPSGKCNAGNLCDPKQGVCVYCELGSAGCQCKGAGACNTGLVCSAGECFDASSLPPTTKTCHTPCLQDLLAAGKVCDADGLIEGCIDGKACVDGSCVEPGSPKPSCASDIECPFFQVCLQGGCYSNCAVNADCPQGQGCNKKACRQPCQVTAPNACPQGMSCASSDGVGGVLRPPRGAGACARGEADGQVLAERQQRDAGQ